VRTVSPVRQHRTPPVRHRTGRLLERLGWAGTALTGAVVGHVLTYLVAFVTPHSRQAALDETGHSYWNLAVAIAIALGVWSASILVIRHFRQGARNERSEEAGVFRSASRLALLQVGLFAGLEVGERLASGAPLRGLLGHDLLPLGLVFQVFVALGLALILRAMATLVEVIARTLLEPPRLRPLGAWPLPSPVVQPSPLLLSGGWGSRGPPSR
jgi:hypothetical protein